MTGFQELRNTLFQLINDTCKTEKLTYSTNQTVEDQSFLLKEHAQAIREACKQGGYTVSFRAAGKSTLTKIRNGNPCKGHEIIHKSIKKNGVKWNYEGPDTVLSNFEGCIGFSSHDESDELHGIWIESENKSKKCLLSEAKNHIDSAYTGDYDMHDLLRCVDTQFSQIIPETREEDVAIDHLNKYLLAASPNDRSSKVQSFLNTNKDKNIKDSAYALIRHGAQTSYWFYLHSEKSGTAIRKLLSNDSALNLLWKNKIMNISTPICFFNPQGDACILENIQQIYLYYKINGILNHIPFVYFLQPLQDIAKSNPQISEVLKLHSDLFAEWATEYFM